MPVDPSNAEEEYFKRAEIHKLRKARAETNAGLAEEAKVTAKKAHWMRCPKCGMELTAIEFRGVQGRWLLLVNRVMDQSGHVMGLVPPQRRVGRLARHPNRRRRSAG